MVHFSRIFSFSQKFYEKLLFPGWFSRKLSVFAKIFNLCFVSGYTFRWLLNPDPNSKWKIFAKNFRKLNIFAKTKIFAAFFMKSEKECSRKYENENFRFNHKSEIENMRERVKEKQNRRNKKELDWRQMKERRGKDKQNKYKEYCNYNNMEDNLVFFTQMPRLSKAF
jgi:hypothetical protein